MVLAGLLHADPGGAIPSNPPRSRPEPITPQKKNNNNNNNNNSLLEYYHTTI
jgi:hypothetical protein